MTDPDGDTGLTYRQQAVIGYLRKLYAVYDPAVDYDSRLVSDALEMTADLEWEWETSQVERVIAEVEANLAENACLMTTRERYARSGEANPGGPDGPSLE